MPNVPSRQTPWLFRAVLAWALWLGLHALAGTIGVFLVVIAGTSVHLLGVAAVYPALILALCGLVVLRAGFGSVEDFEPPGIRVNALDEPMLFHVIHDVAVR